MESNEWATVQSTDSYYSARRKFMLTSLVNLHEKMRWVFAQPEQASQCVKSSWNYNQTSSCGFQACLSSAEVLGFPSPHHYAMHGHYLVHVFPVLPYASKQHVQVPVILALLLPAGQWDTSAFPKRYVLWSDELGKQRACLHPGPAAELLLPSPLPQGSALLLHCQAPNCLGLDICSCFLLSPLMGIALLSE